MLSLKKFQEAVLKETGKKMKDWWNAYVAENAMSSKNKTQAIMDIMLRAFNESIGYCGDRPWVADLERMLDNEGLLEQFIAKFEELSKRDWKSNRSKAALNKRSIVDALVFVRGVPREDAENYVNDQINNYTNSTEEFAKIVNEYCKKNKTK